MKEEIQNRLFDLAAARRSVRRYTNEHIPDDILNEILKVGLAAPCSFGHRPVEFVVVRDKSRIRDLAACKSLGGSQIIGADAGILRYDVGVEANDYCPVSIHETQMFFGI